MKKLSGIIIILFLTFITASAEETEYTNRTFARLSYVTGNTYIQKAADLAYEEGVVNMPITEGDRIGTTDGRAEIYLGKNTYLRLDHETKLDFISLPKPESELIQVKIWAGNVYFSVKTLEEEKGIEIHTSDVSIYLLNQGIYRIDVRENTETEIFVFQGIVEAAGESGSVLIKDAQRLEVIKGRSTSPPTSFVAVANDSFDRWSEYRDLQIRKTMAQRYLPEELEDFEYELDENGDWIYSPPYGQVWVPRNMGPDWRPYYNGRWTWNSFSRWTWLPYESWGWATFHYGRWHWKFGMGWYWIPTTVWGPGWVGWYSGNDYWGWSPLSYYGHPGVIINNTYYGRFSDQYHPHYSRALTVVRKKQLRARNVSKIALNRSSIQNLGRVKLSSSAPASGTVDKKVSIQKLEGKQVLLRKREGATQNKSRRGSSGAETTKSRMIRSVPDKLRPAEIRNIKPTESRNIGRKKAGYPSSPSISSKKYSKSTRSKKSGSTLGRFYKYITGKSITKNKSTPSKSTSRIKKTGKTRSSPTPKSKSSRSKTRTKKIKKK